MADHVGRTDILIIGDQQQSVDYSSLHLFGTDLTRPNVFPPGLGKVCRHPHDNIRDYQRFLDCHGYSSDPRRFD